MEEEEYMQQGLFARDEGAYSSREEDDDDDDNKTSEQGAQIDAAVVY